MSKKTEAIRTIKDRFYDWAGYKMLSNTEDQMENDIQEAQQKLISEIEEEGRVLSSLVNEAFNQ